jgi:adenylate cyclase
MPRQDEGRISRRLAAVMAADVVGYSRLMEMDEEATHRRVKELFGKLVGPAIGGRGGRVISTAGDGLIAEFPSAVDAVRVAVDLQRRLGAQNATFAAEERIDLRIGVNVCDIIADRDDIFGAGVNLAARLQQACEPGGICISDRVLEDVQGKVDAEFRELGERTFKNIARSVRVYGLAAVTEPDAAESSTAALEPRTDQPLIVVLPFKCLSEEREVEFLADAMSEDLNAMLARIPGFVVIARQSASVYRTRSVDSRQIGRELGVRYIVQGSLRPAGPRIRVGAQLIDAATGAQLWADRFDGQVDNVLEMQDQIARAIASRIEPELVRAEIGLIRRRRDANPDAWSSYREAAGLISLKGWSEETLAEGAALLRRASAFDPDFALAHALLALVLSLGARFGFFPDRAASITEARAEAERAISIDHEASEVLGYAGCALTELGDVQRGSEILDRAIEKDPSNAQAWVARGSSQCFFEKMADVGLEKLRHGMRLSPYDHRLGFWGAFYAAGLLQQGRGLEAYEEARTACRRDPQFYVARIVLALTAIARDGKEEAIAALREARRLRPRLTLEEIRLLFGRRASTSLEPLWTALQS